MGAIKPVIEAVAKVSGHLAKELDVPVLKRVADFITGASSEKPLLSHIYRGVPKGSEEVAKVGEEYIHGTPWAQVASRAGKGAFGDSRSTDVLSFPARPDHKLYRGGALAGDPLESTNLLNAKGMTWDEALDKAKELYQYNVIRERARILRESKKYDWMDEDMVKQELDHIPKRVLSDVTSDLIKGTFETDVLNKPGIWSDQFVPPELNKRMPRLRSYNKLEEVLEEKKKLGYDMEDIMKSPEFKILRRK